MDINTEWRGGQRQLLWMGEGLRRHGGRPLFALRTGVPLAARARESGIEVIAIDPLIAEWGPWTVLRLRRVIRRERVAIVHAQSGHTMALAALASLGTRAKIVFARRVTTPLRRNRPTRWKYARARPAHLREPRRRGGPAARRRRARRACAWFRAACRSRSPPRPRRTELLASFGVPAGAPLAVLVASLSAAKDPSTFVRAIAVARREVPALHALIVGDGPLRESLAARVSALGLDGSVHLTGFRTDPEALEAAASVVVLTSRSLEGTPGVLLDALALGKPIVATNVGGVPEVIEDGVSGTPCARWRCRCAWPRDRARAARSGARGAALRGRDAPALRMFSIENTVSRTMDVYRELLGERVGR